MLVDNQHFRGKYYHQLEGWRWRKYSSDTLVSSYKFTCWYYPQKQHGQSFGLLHVRLHSSIILKTWSTSFVLQSRWLCKCKLHHVIPYCCIRETGRLTCQSSRARAHRVRFMKLWCSSHVWLFFTINATNIKQKRNCETLPALTVKFNANVIHCIAHSHWVSQFPQQPNRNNWHYHLRCFYDCSLQMVRVVKFHPTPCTLP
jgi:hypothetical protein